jgi:excisionase family DNA binding protein
MTDGSYDKLLKPGEVAAIFRVDPKTVTRWAKSGKLKAIHTPGGHVRFHEAEVRGALVDALDDDDYIS